MIIEQFLEWMHTAPVDKRAQAASALAKAYLISDLSYDERASAESTMTVLLDDPSSTVRFALADALVNSKNAPRHIIMGLANDTPEIATLVLSRSSIFSDGELVDLVASGTTQQQIAIACRYEISSALCGAIAEVGLVEACIGLMMNSSAKLPQKAITRICERHGGDSEVRKLLLDRKDISIEQRMLLLGKLGSALGDLVHSRNWMPTDRIQETIKESMERCSIACASSVDENEIGNLVTSLIHSKKLTSSYLLRSLCMGNISLFCVALGQLARIPAGRVEAMISQQRITAFRATYIKAGLPISAFDVFATALKVWQQLLSEPEWISRARMPYLVTRQVMADYQGKNDGVVDELLNVLRKISADLAREDARTHVMELTRKRNEAQARETYSKISAITEYKVTSRDKAISVDPEFEKLIEASLAEAFNEDIIELSAQNMSMPKCAANDSPTIRSESVNAPMILNGKLSTAA